jgi:hypothetical protein
VSADGQTHGPPVTPIDLLLPGAWRSSRHGGDAVAASDDALLGATPPARASMTLELPLGALFEPPVLPDEVPVDPTATRARRTGR